MVNLFCSALSGMESGGQITIGWWQITVGMIIIGWLMGTKAEPIFIPPDAPQSHSSIIWGLYNRPEVAVVPSGLNPTPLIIKKNNNGFL
jgi:hypothetical protein